MQQLQPNTDFSDFANGYAFAGMENRSQGSIYFLWEKARQISDQACFCVTRACDENAWSVHVIRPAMKWETSAEEHHAPLKPAFSRLEFMYESPTLDVLFILG